MALLLLPHPEMSSVPTNVQEWRGSRLEGGGALGVQPVAKVVRCKQKST